METWIIDNINENKRKYRLNLMNCQLTVYEDGIPNEWHLQISVGGAMSGNLYRTLKAKNYVDAKKEAEDLACKEFLAIKEQYHFLVGEIRALANRALGVSVTITDSKEKILYKKEIYGCFSNDEVIMNFVRENIEMRNLCISYPDAKIDINGIKYRPLEIWTKECLCQK